MSKVSTYLNFVSETEEAFNFYKVVFKTDFEGGIMRYGDIPASPDMPAMPESVKSLVMHCMMPIMDGHYLMGSDAPVEMGFQVHKGNNSYIMLQPDTREETKQLFDALAVGGIDLNAYSAILKTDGFKPLFAVSIGYRAEDDSNQPSVTPKQRLKLDDVVYSI